MTQPLDDINRELADSDPRLAILINRGERFNYVDVSRPPHVIPQDVLNAGLGLSYLQDRGATLRLVFSAALAQAEVLRDVAHYFTDSTEQECDSPDCRCSPGDGR